MVEALIVIVCEDEAFEFAFLLDQNQSVASAILRDDGRFEKFFKLFHRDGIDLETRGTNLERPYHIQKSKFFTYAIKIFMSAHKVVRILDLGQLDFFVHLIVFVLDSNRARIGAPGIRQGRVAAMEDQDFWIVRA